jgi:hypothetical protein
VLADAGEVVAEVDLGDLPRRQVVVGGVEGDAGELARRLAIPRGPVLGELVAALQEEQAAGTVTSPDDAEAFARSWLAGR